MGIRERLQHDYGWMVDLEPGKVVNLFALTGSDADPYVRCVDGQYWADGDHTTALTDLRCSDDRIQITIRIGGEPHKFCGPWLVSKVMDVHELLRIYHDAVLEQRDRESKTILQDILTDNDGLSRSLLRPLIVPVRQRLEIFAQLLPGAPPISGARVHLRTLITRDVR